MITDSPEEVERIVTQVVENIQRTELTAADEASAYHQLSLIGVTAAAIAKKTGRTKTTVESALKAKASTTGAKALEDGYTLDMALVMAEFEGDQDAIEELESVIRDKPQYFDHIAQKLRDDRESKAKLAVLIEELTAQGKTIVEDAGHYADEENLYISAAKREDGEPATDDDANAYLIGTDYRGQLHTRPVITGWKDLGFTPKYERYSAGSTQAQKGPMNEEQKAERKTLIANNKAMESATTVRRAFVKTLLSKKQAPQGWQYFTVHAITHHSETASGYDGKVAAEMVGATIQNSAAWAWNPLRDHVAITETRPEFSLIALVCAGFEKTIAKDSWRSPGQTHRDYLNQLVTSGYQPSEVESIIIDGPKPAEDTAIN